MKTQYKLFNPIKAIMLISLLLSQVACKKLIEVEAPVTTVTNGNVYANDATAAAVLTGIYTHMSGENSHFSDGGFTSMSLFPALSSDELTLYDLLKIPHFFYYSNTLTSSNLVSTDFWSNIYPVIFMANSAIEGLDQAPGLTPAVKQQLTGEAKFIRAFCYFYLVNLYGGVPLALSTDYKINALLARSSKEEVYRQIIADLKEAQAVLSSDYRAADAIAMSTARVRPNKWAATALLARVYLYQENWEDAETQASTVINESSLYSLPALDEVFLSTSTEAIWQLQPVFSGANTGEGKLFVLPAEGPNTFTHPVYLSNDLAKDFETGDQRKVNWVNSVVAGTIAVPITYYYPFKYKIGGEITDVKEYIMVLRLGELYLIRAEARAQLNNIAGSKADINAIRFRAGGGSLTTPGTLANTLANDQASLLVAIEQERRVELFTEWGHRWFDLKRLKGHSNPSISLADEIMPAVTTAKGGTWSTNWQLYPIPLTDLQRDPNLVPNPGY